MTTSHTPFKSKKHTYMVNIWKNKALYVFILPLMIYLCVFNYMPMYGLQIAFKNYSPAKGIWGSPWVGMKYFDKFLTSYSFWNLLRNTLILSLYHLITSFPLAILLALIIHYTPTYRFKKLVQTATYAPHFVSTVVVVGMLFIFFAPSSGIVNNIIVKLGGTAYDYRGSAASFPHLYVWTGIWQHMGWNSIIYIAALVSVPPELHEAATVDGAGKFKRIIHVDLPAILPTAVIMLIMDCGRIMNLGHEKILLMQASSNLSASEVISTYVYKIGLQSAQFSYATAIGLFNNIINCILLVLVNFISNRLSGEGLW